MHDICEVFVLDFDSLWYSIKEDKIDDFSDDDDIDTGLRCGKSVGISEFESSLYSFHNKISRSDKYLDSYFFSFHPLEKRSSGFFWVWIFISFHIGIWCEHSYHDESLSFDGTINIIEDTSDSLGIIIDCDSWNIRFFLLDCLDCIDNAGFIFLKIFEIFDAFFYLFRKILNISHEKRSNAVFLCLSYQSLFYKRHKMSISLCSLDTDISRDSRSWLRTESIETQKNVSLELTESEFTEELIVHGNNY